MSICANTTLNFKDFLNKKLKEKGKDAPPLYMGVQILVSFFVFYFIDCFFFFLYFYFALTLCNWVKHTAGKYLRFCYSRQISIKAFAFITV